jgi:hypothetical protein
MILFFRHGPFVDCCSPRLLPDGACGGLMGFSHEADGLPKAIIEPSLWEARFFESAVPELKGSERSRSCKVRVLQSCRISCI